MGLGLTVLGNDPLNDWRMGKSTQHWRIAMKRTAMMNSVRADQLHILLAADGFKMTVLRKT
jgi:hypothetical protein